MLLSHPMGCVLSIPMKINIHQSFVCINNHKYAKARLEKGGLLHISVLTSLNYNCHLLFRGFKSSAQGLIILRK